MGINFAMHPPAVSHDLSVSLATGAPTSIDRTHMHSLIIPVPSNSSVDPIGIPDNAEQDGHLGLANDWSISGIILDISRPCWSLAGSSPWTAECLY